jgi:hypothetical protein
MSAQVPKIALRRSLFKIAGPVAAISLAVGGAGLAGATCQSGGTVQAQTHTAWHAQAGQVAIPSIIGADAHGVRNQLAALRLTNVNFVPGSPAFGPMNWQFVWHVVAISPPAGTEVSLGTPVTVTVRR